MANAAARSSSGGARLLRIGLLEIVVSEEPLICNGVASDFRSVELIFTVENAQWPLWCNRVKN